jgi:hypothetical protein
MSLLSKLPLVILVAISATLELVLNRVGVHLMSARERSGALFKVVDLGGLYTFYLTGLLALAAFSWATLVQIRDRRLLRAPDRIAFTVLSALFLPMAAMGLFFNLPQKVAPHLNTAFGLVLAAMVVGFLRQRAPLRAKLGVFYLAAPLLLHCYWLMTQQIPALSPEGRLSELPSQLFVTAEHLVVVGAFAAFLFFAPFPRLVNLLEPIPVVVAVLVTSGIALLARYRYLEAAQAAYYGLGLNLPPPSVHGLMHLAALFFFSLTLGALVMRGTREREVALGLYLVGVSGFHLQLPYQLLLTLLGMMQVVRGSLDERALEDEPAEAKPGAFPEPAVWKHYLQRLARACASPPDSGEAVLLQNGGQQVAHLRGQRDRLPFTLRLAQKGGSLQQIEVTIGKHPKEAAPISVTRRGELRGRRVTQRSAGPKVKLHQPSLDEQFEVHWAADRPTELLHKHAESLERLVHGWLGVWPGEGVHYLTQPGPDGWPVPVAEVVFSAEDASVEEVQELVALLEAIARNAGVK